MAVLILTLLMILVFYVDYSVYLAYQGERYEFVTQFSYLNYLTSMLNYFVIIGLFMLLGNIMPAKAVDTAQVMSLFNMQAAFFLGIFAFDSIFGSHWASIIFCGFMYYLVNCYIRHLKLPIKPLYIFWLLFVVSVFSNVLVNGIAHLVYLVFKVGQIGYYWRITWLLGVIKIIARVLLCVGLTYFFLRLFFPKQNKPEATQS